MALLSHALRHDPESHFISVDAQGWAPLGDVLLAIRCERKQFRRISDAELRRIVDNMVPRRFEIQSNHIRATYGHSLPHVETGIERIPPTILFHGTTAEAWNSISKTGLQPTNRRFVHLTDDQAYATEVAKAKSPTSPILLQIAAQRVYGCGQRFFQANHHVWLTANISAEFVNRLVGRG